MAVAYGAVTQLSQQYPPPLLPKPGKDNVRLQKLLKRTAKKKASAQTSQSAALFRSSLSPVNEASPDLEHSDHSTPPKTPETPFSLYSVQQAPRFTVRPLYQHVASPYPQRAAYGRAARFSPQTVSMPSYSYSQHVTTVSSYSAPATLSGVSPAPGPVPQLVVPKISLPASSVPEATVPAAEVKKTAFSTFAETHTGLTPAAAEATPQPKYTKPGPTPYPATGGQALIRPLTVLTPLVKSRSPRPTFKATEPSKSPKPMFDVPQIRMYTASTSYYETSRTPPVYDSAGLMAIGTSSETKQDLTQPALLGTDLQRRTPTSDTKRGTTPTKEMNTIITPTSEIKRVTPTSGINRVTPTSEIKRLTPTSEIRRVTPTSETRRVTPTSEIKRATPTSDIKRATPTSDIKRATPSSEIKRATPTSEIKRATPTSEIKRATPTSEIKRATPTSEIKRATPTSEIRVKTPTYELQTLRTSAGRPRTPAYHITRAATPVFEISRPNPLLFAVSPITVEPERSRSPKTASAVSGPSASQSVKTTEPKPTDTILNGDIHSDMTPAAIPIQQSIKKSKSEPDLTREKMQSTPAGSQRLSETPSSVPTTPAVTSRGYQRAKTPTYEASRLMNTSPGYKRPKTPTYGTSPSGVSPVAFQRPKTPTQVAQKSKSLYRGLTPAEYAAYGGIRTYAPAFGISSSKVQTDEEVKATKEESAEYETPTQEPSVKAQSTAEVSKVKETPKETNKTHLRDEKAAATPLVPVIIVSQASDTSGTTLTQDTSTASSQVEVKQEKTVIQETAKAKPPTEVGKTPEKQKVKTPVQEAAKAKTTAPEAKHPLPKGNDQDPLKAVRKLLGKDKAQTAEQKSGTETKAVISDQKEPEKSAAATKAKAEGSKPNAVAPALPVKAAAELTGSEDKGKDKKSESASAVKSAPDKQEGDESLPAAEALLTVIRKPKGMKSKVSGWSRLKKHMVVEQEEPKFPETGSQKEATEQDQSGLEKADEKAGDKPGTQGENQTKDAPKATKMWDAVLFQMFSTKENILHQIELNKNEEEAKEGTKDELQEIPSFAYRLPVLLFSPKFDAKKLREAASRPVTKISTVFEMGLIGRKGKDEEPKDFNRKARGFTAT
ncbi:mucin-5AC [Chelmon rostratus]|uniref:mucin-5AC n=1 Tax=Chelmon rostratus TaxID=109905 RepID=UPI001BE959FF|nr:mucin-5AC [Chelmon rostratus]